MRLHPVMTRAADPQATLREMYPPVPVCMTEVMWVAAVVGVGFAGGRAELAEHAGPEGVAEGRQRSLLAVGLTATGTQAGGPA